MIRSRAVIPEETVSTSDRVATDMRTGSPIGTYGWSAARLTGWFATGWAWISTVLQP
jgi:hypothetical protein